MGSVHELEEGDFVVPSRRRFLVVVGKKADWTNARQTQRVRSDITRSTFKLAREHHAPGVSPREDDSAPPSLSFE
jgi:hypothetical protein